MEKNKKNLLKQGMKDGIPIGLAYFGVALAIGISAKNAGLSVFEGFLTSLLVNASAGEHAGFKVIQAHGPYIELALVTLVVNARYILMSFALSQKIRRDTPLLDKFLLSFYLTDEYFGLAIGQKGFVNPTYIYGAILVASPLWALGTAIGIEVGTILPSLLVNALGVALYGMFLAIIIPPAKSTRPILVVVFISFISSLIFNLVPGLAQMSGGTKIIILTLIIASLAAYFFPIREDYLT